jgi:hypothetical protein
MLHIVIAIIVAAAVGYYFYTNIHKSKDDEVSTTDLILKAGLPGIASGIITFYLAKTFVDGESSFLGQQEPTMQGSFFDP